MKKVQTKLKDPRIIIFFKALLCLLKKRKKYKEETIPEKMKKIDQKAIGNFVKIKVNERACIFWLKAYDRLSNAGFNPLYVFVHIYHETGGFKHIIGKHNYWGIKAGNSTIDKVKVKTHEYVDGKKISTFAYFRDWHTLEKALDWYMSLIKRLYPNSYKNRNIDFDLYAEGLISGVYKYATDPTYVEKLTKLFLHLTQN